MTQRNFDIYVNVQTSGSASELDKVKKKLDEVSKSSEKVGKTSEKTGSKTKKSTDTSLKGFLDLSKGITVAGFAVTAIAGAIVAAGTAMITSANNAAELTREMTNLSNIARTTLQGFQSLTFATNTVGVGADKTADIIKDLNDKLGDFVTTGGGEFSEFFRVLGDRASVTATQLQEMTGPQQLQAIASQMEAANLPMATQIKLLEGLASDYSHLLPLLTNNGEALKALETDFKSLNAATSSLDAAKLSEYALATDRFSKAWEGMTTRIGAASADILLPAVNLLTDLVAVMGMTETGGKIALIDGLDTLDKKIAATEIELEKAKKKLEQVDTGMRGAGTATRDARDAVNDLTKSLELLNKQKTAPGASVESQAALAAKEAARSAAEETVLLQNNLALNQKTLDIAKQGNAELEKHLANTKIQAELTKYEAQLKKDRPELAGVENTAARQQLIALKEQELQYEQKIGEQKTANTEAERASVASAREAASAAKERAATLSQQTDFVQGLRDELALAKLTTEEAKTRLQYENAIREAGLTNEQRAVAVALTKELIAANKVATDTAKEKSRSDAVKSTTQGLEDQLAVLSAINDQERQRIEIEQTIRDSGAVGVEAERMRILNEQIIAQKERNEMIAQEKQAVNDLAKAMGSWAAGSKDAIKAVLAQLIQLAAIRAGFGQSSFLGGFLTGFGGMQGFAEGGQFNSGETFMVGEKGPEIITANAPGSVIPNHKLGGGGGMTQNISLSINGSIVASDELDRRFQEFAVAVSASTQNLLKNQMRTGGVLAHGYN